MPPEGVLSNIRVFITWDDQTVFAGEDIKCHITFKNIAPGPNQTRSSSQQPPTIPERSRQPSPLLSPRTKPNNGLTPPAPTRGHRSTLSLTVPSSSSRLRGPPQQWTPTQSSPQRPGHAHKRSLSIVSIGSAATIEEQSHGKSSPARPPRPPRGHGRSASLQISPRGGLINGPQSAALPSRRPFGSESSPLYNSFPPTKHGFGRASGASTVPNTPGFNGSHPPKRSPGAMPDFKFPMTPSPQSTEGVSPTAQPVDYLSAPGSGTGGVVSLPVRSKDPIPTITEQSVPAAARILSAASIAGGTPRSSGEFYSLSNNSSETLASEYVTQPLHGGRRPAHLRRGSGMLSISQARLPESLMMGYAQVQGSFTLDGSLINLGPFEAVKRKAVLGGQGGGVIGVESSKRASGLLTGFGWGSLGNSIGELLGGGELSSIKQMRGVASSKSIPLLSTPQSILFVDLQLAPGESRTYEYSFKLPKGLPPTHRGKAMKISYSLVIGTQRPGGTKEQQVRSVEIPFRVLGSVNSHGEILGHDLLSPYIILRDLAKVKALDKSAIYTPSKRHKPDHPGSTYNGFLGYVEELLDRPHRGLGLLSPTATAPQSRRTSAFEESASAKDAIDLAIIRSNLSSDSGQSSNRFEIARNGRRVGVVMLARPAYKLGESVNMAIDFTGAEIPCYAIHAALETAERVEPTLALRSEASVHRVTRKVYGSSSEATLFARRVVFSPTIPISATPEFVTSGLSLEWKIRIEFVVPSSATEGPDLADSDTGTQPHPLLEEISRDERGGLVLVAAENLDCESFEVAVPLRVYGAVCNGLERLERDEAQQEGLVV
ncbi:Rgp1-domain-containing protein [Annulohypoxylon truncatum]|uniref:Rgp1-domain-containing protein n=1 Tax=Annulohypoxylon truncatum TaxID=327061 RepID=UPI0020076F10|nr:Rgp1-domain-containing protein [Annulohypoxylon truncatum]KAI1210303.1 Rgp1-domain-containing protein [Annulohypoxylon truncatum]